MSTYFATNENAKRDWTLIDAEGEGRGLTLFKAWGAAFPLAYRERIRGLAAPVQFVFLDGSAELIGQRMAMRSGHYMPPELLASQFSALERPEADEDDVIRLDITRPVGQLLSEALAALQADRATARI